ncbi:hypothetical protein B0T19DRAFT_466099 [Cercophora scortea]|uniref:Uncharacterized protein n=1 Tax=Cercophora scortea TaxID=314031 RepID=A0AAE0IA53_9PEZI|nr:hypothetical protein B0T19DRAFT_466099 [Cercophora scortea]
MKELLDTDRVNFLVWRYLIESMHLLTKGLVYEDHERKYIEQQQQQVPQNVPGKAEARLRGVFGPLKYEQARHDPEDDRRDDEEDDSDVDAEHEEDLELDHEFPVVHDQDVEPEEIEGSRKRQMDRQHHALSNGSPAKRQRLSNGYENGADSATTPMEIDEADHDNNHAYPSPLEGEQAASPPPRTEGPDKGTQVEKSHELTHETVFLQLGAGESSPESEAASASPALANENPIVLHCEWNPKDPSILAAAGTDALARVWTVSRGAAPDGSDGGNPGSLPDHVPATPFGAARPFRNLIEDDVPKSAIVSAMAWNSTGDAIALAIEVENKARISIWSLDGTISHRFDGIEPPIIKLRWSPNSDFILGISPENRGTLVTIFSSTMPNSLSHFLPDHDLVADPLDAAWISETEFVLCGGDSLVCLLCTPEGIVPGREFHAGRDEAFSQIHFDRRSKLIATSSDKGKIDIWDESGHRRSISAHIGVITALQWQPLQTDPAEDERLLASSGEDGVICIWNVRNSDNKPKYSMTMAGPVLGLSISPDGAFIAGATSDKILIWKLGEHVVPRATWSRVPHPGWQSPKANSDTEEEYSICLAWDSDGQKLVYGANSRLAVINFR